MNHVTYISAGAGSGKTYTLTSILADLIVKEKMIVARDSAPTRYSALLLSDLP